MYPRNSTANHQKTGTMTASTLQLKTLTRPSSQSTPSLPTVSSPPSSIYSFSLGKPPGSIKAPTTSAHKRKSIVPPTITTTNCSSHQSTPYRQKQQQQLTEIYKHYDHVVSSLSQQRQRQKDINCPRQEYGPISSDPMVSLFQKVRNQAATSQQNPHSHAKLPRHTPPTATAAEFTLSPSPNSTISPSDTTTDILIEQTKQRAAKLKARQERRQYIRAKAEEVRLELLALEQMEKDLDLEIDNEDSIDDIDKLPSSASLLFNTRSPPLPLDADGTNNVTQFTEPVSMESKQPHGHQQRISSSTAYVVSPHLPSTSDSHGTSPMFKPAFTKQKLSGTTALSRSPASTHSSASPPISPLSEYRTVEGIPVAHSCNIVNSPTRILTKKAVGWKPDISVSDNWDSHSSQTEMDDEDGLYGYFQDSAEDLRDITLSDMMAKHLNILRDIDDSEDCKGPIKQEQEEHSDEYDAEQAFDEADMTVEDRTRIFMSNLEYDFDQQLAKGQGIPPLLSETLPENDYDLSSMSDYELQERYSAFTPRSAIFPPQRNYDSPLLGKRYSPSARPSTTIVKDSILDGFFRTLSPQTPESRFPLRAPQGSTVKENIMEGSSITLPPLSRYSESKRSFQTSTLDASSSRKPILDGMPMPRQSFLQNSSKLGTPETDVDELPTLHSKAHRALPVLTPIITSKERCQQILQNRLKDRERWQRKISQLTPSSQSSILSISPMTESPHSEPSALPFYEKSTSEQNTPTSVYHSAREEFSFSSIQSRKEQRNSNVGLKTNSIITSLSAINLSSELIQPPPAPTQESRRAKAGATENILTGYPRARHQLLDTTIIRPTKYQTLPSFRKESLSRSESEYSSPWSVLSPTPSNDLRNSESTGGSRWSCSYPSSHQSSASSPGSASVDKLTNSTGAEVNDVYSRQRIRIP
ncbi:hypothetical protein FBU30_005365 [Linnemannia zychae]|nr:hypothetical protein FBU30_005365 [Linnemannia zychae]